MYLALNVECDLFGITVPRSESLLVVRISTCSLTWSEETLLLWVSI